MAQLAQGQRLTLPITATQGYYLSTLGAAIVRVTPSNGGAFVVTIGNDETDVGWFGFDASLELIAQSGVLTYNTTPSALTAVQLGDQRDSDAVDVALTANDLRNNQAKQQQSVILFGDSYAEAQNFPTPPFSGDTLSISLWRFVLSRLGASVNVIRNAGVSGNTAQNMLDRYDTDVKPFASDWVFFDVGVNDFFGFGLSATSVFANVQILLRKMIADGRKVLMINCPPQASTRASFTAGKSTECALYNKLIADYVSTINGVVLVDVYSVMLDWMDTTNGASVTKYLAGDGVHLSTFGTLALADAIMPQISRHISQNPILPLSPLDLGVLGTRAVLAGTGGSNGTASTGVVATGYTVQRASGTNGSVVNTKLVNGQRSVVTLIAANGISNFRVGINLLTQWQAIAGQTVNTVVKYRVKTESGAVHVRSLQVQLMVNDGAVMTYATDGTLYGGNPPASDEVFDTGVCLSKLKPFAIPATVTNGSFAIDLLVDSATGGVFSIELYGIDCRVQP